MAKGTFHEHVCPFLVAVEGGVVASSVESEGVNNQSELLSAFMGLWGKLRV